uniref:(California timema) hypothetical protein n=1 Tax=Timema californicum TaxID=61474 RepID=A0A7R9J9P0_TIMCA|nr:unnamed protein product [Timema californicum]
MEQTLASKLGKLKWTLYQQVLQRYLHLSQHPPSPPENTNTTTTLEVSVLIIHAVLNTVTVQERKKAELLLEHIISRGDISWDENGDRQHYGIFPKTYPREFHLATTFRLTLEGKWEAALAEFQYPCSFTTVPEDKNIVWYNWQRVKELSVLSVCGTLLENWVLKPPYATEELSATSKKQADHIVNKLHGIPWDSSDVDYSLLETLISRATTRAEIINVKWAEKKTCVVKCRRSVRQRGCSSLRTLNLGYTMCMAHSSVWNFCPISIVSGDQIIEDGHEHHKKCSVNKPVVPFCTRSNTMEDQDVCARKAKPVEPLAITSIFDGVDAKLVIVKNNFTPYVQLEKCGRNDAVFKRTEWQEPGNYNDRMVVISEKQDAGLKRVSYLSPSWVRLCDVWDLIDVTIDHQDMWSTPIVRYCNDLINTLVVDVCDTLTESVDVIGLEQNTVETHIINLDLISIKFALAQIKVALVTIILHYKVSVNKKTMLPLTMDKGSLLTYPTGGLWLNFNRRNQHDPVNQWL